MSSLLNSSSVHYSTIVPLSSFIAAFKTDLLLFSSYIYAFNYVLYFYNAYFINIDVRDLFRPSFIFNLFVIIYNSALI